MGHIRNEPPRGLQEGSWRLRAGLVGARVAPMRWLILSSVVLVAGCDVVQRVLPGRDAPEPVASEPVEEVASDLGETSEDPLEAPEDVDPDPTASVPNAALPPPVGVGSTLGTTVAALGDPTEGGMWLKTPLVSADRPGQVRYRGQVVAVTLRPLDGPAGAGSQMSLRAMQTLGAPLTELVEVTVEAL